MEGKIIAMICNPKTLRDTYDNLLHFAAHATYINAKVKMRNKVLKAVAGTTWRMDKETIITTYKAIG